MGTNINTINTNHNKSVEFRYVQVFIEFLRIGEINTMHEKYTGEVLIESRWIDTTNSITKYDPNSDWNPQLYIENLLTKSKETITYSVYNENGSNIITETRQTQGVFWKSFKLHNFPVDIQELSIVVTTRHRLKEVKLVQDPTKISFIDLNATNTFIEQHEWKLFKLVKIGDRAAYDDIQTKADLKHPELIMELNASKQLLVNSKIVATCFISRKQKYFLANAYFLIFLLTALPLTMFSITYTTPHNRLHPVITIILTTVSFKWAINRSLPYVSYLTSLDLYTIISLSFMVLNCIWNGIIGNVTLLKLSANQKKELDSWAPLVLGILFVIIQLGFIIWFIGAYKHVRDLEKEEKEFLKKFNFHHKIK